MQRIRARVFPWREYENDTAVEQGVPRAKGDWRTKTPVFLTEKHPDAKSSLSVFNQIHFHLGRSVLLQAGAVL